MHIFITGGSGFIGTNATKYFLSKNHRVTIYDNLSRAGSVSNLAWLQGRFSAEKLAFIEGDLRDYGSLCRAIEGADAVLHLGGQVAVTTSIIDPRDDFETNALGTFNLLEAVRNYCPAAAVIYASTNKVYGDLEQVGVVEEADAYRYADRPFGIPEAMALDFHSPYGCSKGAGDQYVLDYARIYGLKTISFRQSCIYGPHQFGVEDQGWVAHFVIAVIKNRPIAIYGDGKQVRDVLHVDDLMRAYEIAFARADQLAGQAFNIGGGPANTLSIWQQFGALLSELAQRSLLVEYGDWRPGDQRIFVSDIRKATEQLDWTPQITPQAGIASLYKWVEANATLFD